MKGKFVAQPAVLAAGLLAASLTSSPGAMTLSLDAGPGPDVTIVDNGAGDMLSAPGAILWIGSLPNSPWYLTVSAGLGKPIVGSQFDPRIDLLVNANSWAAGDLTVRLADSGFGPFAVGAGNATLWAGGIGGSMTASGTVNDSVVASLGPFLNGAWDDTTTGIAGGLTSTFTIGETVTIHHAAAGHSGGDFEFRITPVPEPSTLLAGACLLLPLALGIRNFRASKR